MIIKEILKYKGIYHNIFGELLEKLVFEKEIENLKNILKGVGYIDIDEVFTSDVDKQEFKNISKIIFKFQEKTNEKK